MKNIFVVVVVVVVRLFMCLNVIKCIPNDIQFDNKIKTSKQHDKSTDTRFRLAIKDKCLFCQKFILFYIPLC